jgi:hypothetical protein
MSVQQQAGGKIRVGFRQAVGVALRVLSRSSRPSMTSRAGAFDEKTHGLLYGRSVPKAFTYRGKG